MGGARAELSATPFALRVYMCLPQNIFVLLHIFLFRCHTADFNEVFKRILMRFSSSYLSTNRVQKVQTQSTALQFHIFSLVLALEAEDVLHQPTVFFHTF